MDTQTFDQEVGDLASSLGDTTRRGIYIAVRESPEPVTVSQIAASFDLHPNVARHHLDRLVGDGWLQVTHRRRTDRRGPGAGRPAKHYEPTDKEVSVQFPARRHDLLAELLLRALERVAPDEAPGIAEQIGREYGAELAQQIGLPEDAGFEVAVQAVARTMMGMGFDTEAQPTARTLLTRSCPFGETATNHPEIVCRVDQGIVSGLLGATHQPTGAVHVTPHETADEHCVTDV
jgi:predicted ArsR family transcriptional regulator